MMASVRKRPILCTLISICFLICWKVKPDNVHISYRKDDKTSIFELPNPEISLTDKNFGATSILSKGHTFNRTLVTEIQRRVSKVMKPWQTMQIFLPNIQPENMMISSKFKDIAESKALNRTFWIEERARSCALVGNSGILLDSGCGDAIDQSDFIFRMNLAAFGREYSQDVGSKVSFMTINALQIKELHSCLTKQAENSTNKAKPTQPCSVLLKRLGMLETNSVLFPARGRFEQLVEILPVLRKQFHLKFSVAYPPKDIITVAKRLWNFNSPSTGVGIYTAATQLCENITLFGFYPFQKDKFNRTLLHHYYDPEAKINYTSNCHDMPEEHQFLLDLDRHGAIRMINNCTVL